MNGKTLGAKQRGASTVGLLFKGLGLILLFLVLIRTVPTVNEYYSIVKAVDKAKNEQTVAAIQDTFDKQAFTDRVTSISGKDLIIVQENDKMYVSFSYDKQISLVHPVSLMIHYSGGAKGP